MTNPNTSDAFAGLHGYQYMNLTTFRKSGEGVPTPVWFAEEDGKLYVLTGKNLGKVKRLRNNPQVQVAPCNIRGKPLGPVVEARGRILPPEDFVKAKIALNSKYGLIK